METGTLALIAFISPSNNSFFFPTVFCPCSLNLCASCFTFNFFAASIDSKFFKSIVVGTNDSGPFGGVVVHRATSWYVDQSSPSSIISCLVIEWKHSIRVTSLSMSNFILAFHTLFLILMPGWKFSCWRWNTWCAFLMCGTLMYYFYRHTIMNWFCIMYYVLGESVEFGYKWSKLSLQHQL